MPLIRYRTGDYTRILPGPCPCGSEVLRFSSALIRARISDAAVKALYASEKEKDKAAPHNSARANPEKI